MNARWIRFVAVVAILLVAVSATAAQTIPHQPDRLVIHAGRLLEVKTGRWLTNQNIFIEGDKIVRVEPAGVQALTGRRIVDLNDASVLAGLIDCHVHLTISPSSFGYELLGISEARQTLTGAANGATPCLSVSLLSATLARWVLPMSPCTTLSTLARCPGPAC